jgi:flagellar biogenesis protein FliO
MEPLQVIFSLFGVVGVIIGCYYVTYYISVKASGKSRGGLKNRNISLLDNYAFARDKSFCVVKIADKVYIVGVTNQTMTLLDTVDAAAFAEMTADNREMPAWNMTPVGMYGNKLTRKVVAFVAEKTGKTQRSDSGGKESDFSANMKTKQQIDSEEWDSKFVESMKAAQYASENASGEEEPGQPDSLEPGRTENPEGS